MKCRQRFSSWKSYRSKIEAYKRNYLSMKMIKFQKKFSFIQNRYKLKIYKNNFRLPIQKTKYLNKVIHFVRMLRKYIQK